MDKMFCYQCQETAKGTGCTSIGVCGKDAETSGLQDLLLHTEKGVAAYSAVFRKNGKAKELLEGKVNRYLINSLFITITNANFDDDAILDEIKAGLKLREELKALATDEEKKEAEKYGADLVNWYYESDEDLIKFEKQYIDEKRFYPIITDFRRTSQPFIKYYLNDILVENTEPCQCGSVLQRIEKIEGRSDDIFKFTNKFGKEIVVFPDFIRRTILFVENIREYQVFQINDKLLEVAILNVTDRQKELVKNEFNKLFSSLNIENIEIKFINYEIDKTKKLKRIVRKVEK